MLKPAPTRLCSEPASRNYLGTGGSLLSAEMRGHEKLLCHFFPDLVLQNQIETIVLTPDISKMDLPSKELTHSAPYHAQSKGE